MKRFTKESLERLRSRIDLAGLISSYVTLKKQGTTYKGLCPFHDEKSPSFIVDTNDSHYHCFGCGAHGDAIHFLMQHVKMGFVEACENLADRFSCQLEETEHATDEKHTPKSRLKEVMEAGCRFYQWFLLYTKEGQVALQYLYDRGLPLQFIQTFRIGLAPRNDGLLKKYLNACGFDYALIEEVGLIHPKEKKHREFFLERITFPIQDPMGSVVGFSARKISEKTYGGKYINTQNTALFKKSKVLFGLNACRKRIIKEHKAIIAEGQLDVLRLIYHGFDYTVAALGTAFGQEHVQELIQLGVTRVYLLFDGDTAGIQASIKTGHLFQKKSIEVFVASLPAKMDPDSLLLEQGPLGITNALSTSKEYLHFLYEQGSKEVRLESPAEKNLFIQKLAEQIREWEDPILIHESLKKLSALSNVPEHLLGVGDKMPSHRFLFKTTSMTQLSEINPDKILEQDLIRPLFMCGKSRPDIFQMCQKNIAIDDLFDSFSKKMYEEIIRLFQKGEEISALTLVQCIEDSDFDSYIKEILVKKVNLEKAHDMIKETILRIKERNWLHEREAIKMRIHSGVSSEEEVLVLAKKFDELKANPPSPDFS